MIGGEAVAEKVHGDAEVVAVYGSYVDELLMVQPVGSKYDIATNHLCSLVVLADSTGAVVERCKYDEYDRLGTG